MFLLSLPPASTLVYFCSYSLALTSSLLRLFSLSEVCHGFMRFLQIRRLARSILLYRIVWTPCKTKPNDLVSREFSVRSLSVPEVSTNDIDALPRLAPGVWRLYAPRLPRRNLFACRLDVCFSDAAQTQPGVPLKRNTRRSPFPRQRRPRNASASRNCITRMLTFLLPGPGASCGTARCRGVQREAQRRAETQKRQDNKN